MTPSPIMRSPSTARSSRRSPGSRRRTAIVVVAGLVEQAADGRRVRNTVVAVDASGVVAVYRKLHLYDAFGQRESDWVEPGELAAA